MLKFETLLSHNNMSETDQDLPSGILTRIQKIRKLQQDLADADGDEKTAIADKIQKADDEIMEKLPEFFEVIDEEAEKAKAKEAEKAKKAKEAAEAYQAKEAEKAKKEKEAEQAKKTAEAAKAQKDADAAEEARKKKEQEDADSKPANTDSGALEKLYKKGKTTVSRAELKAAGFNTGFWGNLGANGCTCGNYRIYREDPHDEQFQLSKIR